MSFENKIIRLASIDAASQTVELPESFVQEKEGIVKELENVQMLIVRDGKFTFVDPKDNALYQESFSGF